MVETMETDIRALERYVDVNLTGPSAVPLNVLEDMEMISVVDELYRALTAPLPNMNVATPPVQNHTAQSTATIAQDEANVHVVIDQANMNVVLDQQLDVNVLPAQQLDVNVLPAQEANGNPIILENSSMIIPTQTNTVGNAAQIIAYASRVRNILRLTNKGRLMLRKESLLAAERKYLVNTLGKHILQTRTTVTFSAVYELWAAGIAKVFPEESAATFYSRIKRGRTVKSFGLLYNRVQNQLASERTKLKKDEEEKRKLEDLERAGAEQQQPADSLDQDTAEQAPIPAEQTDEEQAVSSSYTLLLSAVVIDTFTTSLWEKTYEHRQTKRPDSILDYITLYPCLKSNNALELLNWDFSRQYPDSIHSMQQTWPVLSLKIVDAALKRKIKEVDTYQAFSEEIRAALLLPFFFPSINVSAPKALPKEKKTSKPSRKQAQKSFIIHIHVMNDLEPKLVKLGEECLKYGQTVQPLVVIVGDPLPAPPEVPSLKFYVVINGIRYQRPSFVSCFDSCFKSFFALDAGYPAECVRTWFYIQTVIYKIKTSKDISMTQILSAVTDTKF